MTNVETDPPHPSPPNGPEAAAARAARWAAERDFGDRTARAAAERLTPFPESSLVRYARMRRRHLLPEFRLRLLGDLRGQRVLDLGCGDGCNAATLAALGARVTGIDIAPRAIEVARARAAINAVGDRTEFVCAPIESVDFPPASFDVVWGNAVLHHLIADLDLVMTKLVRWCRADAVLLFTEPVCLGRLLPWLRGRFPVATEATPDERPLGPGDLAVVTRHLSAHRLWYFSLLTRLGRPLLGGEWYELAPRTRRAVYDALALADAAVLALPPLRSLAGQCLLLGRPHDPRTAVVRRRRET